MQLSQSGEIADSRDTSAKPVLVALLATGAGVAALAHPGIGLQSSSAPKFQPASGTPLAAEFRVSPSVTLTPPLPVVPQPVAPRVIAAVQGPPPGVATRLEHRAAAEIAGGYSRTPLADAPALSAVMSAAKPVDEPFVAAAEAQPYEAPLIAESDPLVQVATAHEEAAPAPDPVAEKTDVQPELVLSSDLELEEPAAPEAIAEPLVPEVAAEPPPTLLVLAAPEAIAEPPVPEIAAQPTPAEPAAAPAEPARQRMMPAAELKAMMIAEVASRAGMLAAEQDYSHRDGRRMARTEDAPPYSRYSRTERGIEFDIPAQVNGSPAGNVPLLIADGENISVRLSDLLAAIEPQMDSSLYAALSPSPSAGEYVTFNTLRAHGIAVRFDAQDHLVLGAP